MYGTNKIPRLSTIKKKMGPIFGKYLLMQVNSSLEGKGLGKGEKELQLLLSTILFGC